MKKLYTYLSICLLSTPALSQGYYPMLDSVSNDWYFSTNIIPVRMQQSTICTYGWIGGPTMHRYTAGDTLVNGNTWKVLLEQEYASSAFCDYGYIREDTAAQKIYFMDNQFNPEVLLYDFSMQPGDSIHRTFYQTSGFYMDGWYRLDSISTITINAGVRRLFYLYNTLSFYPLQWIESVGHPGDLAYLYSCNTNGGMLIGCFNDPISRDFCMLLTCFEHHQQKVYFDSCAHSQAVNNWCFMYADSCNYWNICSSLEENILISGFDIVPNPSNEPVMLLIESLQTMTARVAVFTLEGRKTMELEAMLQQGSNEVVLDTELLDAGCYVVALETKSGTLIRKLIRMQ